MGLRETLHRILIDYPRAKTRSNCQRGAGALGEDGTKST